MQILAIDPGPTKSAFVVWNGKLVDMGHVSNDALLVGLYNYVGLNALVVEQIKSYGMAVSDSIFDTVFWSGRFCEAFAGPHYRLPRMTVKMHLCHDSRAKDANIRQAIIDRFGGKEAAIGLKKTPGPLYGVTGDIWAALAVALTWYDMEVP